MGNTGIDPQKDMNGFIDQWYQSDNRYKTDYTQLLAMINQMLELAKKGEVGAAFQLGQMVVVPGAMQVQGDSMAKLAASMNIASAMEEFTTEAQKDMNAGGKMTPAQAQDFVKSLKEFYNEINTLPPPKWLDAGTKAALDEAITKICGMFGHVNPNYPYNIITPTNPNDLDPNYVLSCIQDWSNNPTKTNPAGQTGQQNLQALQAGFTQWNNTESAQSQVLQSQEQFASNIYNQYMNTCTDIFQASQKQAQSMVQNQKTQ